MSKTLVSKFTPNITAQVKALFGPAPLHNRAHEKIFDAKLQRLARDIKPRDGIEEGLLWDLTCYAYEIWWWRHLRNRLISQAHKEDLQRRAVEIVLTADRRKQTLDPSYVRKPNASLPEPKKSKAEVEAARDAEIKNIDAETKKALEELKQAEGGPVDEAALFRNWIERYELADRRLTLEEEKYHRILASLEEHRHGLGQHLRQVSDEIIDVVAADEDPVSAREEDVQLPSPAPAEAEVPQVQVPSRFVVAELTPPSAEESASPQVTSNSDCREPAGSDLVASSATEGAVPSTTNGSGSMELVPGKPPQGP